MFFSSVKTGSGLNVYIPDLASSLDQISAQLNPKIMKKVYRKAVSAGGRVLLKKAKELVPNSRAKRGKKSPKGRYGRSGILKKSLKMYYRVGKSGVRPYVVIGSDRDTSENAQRGKKTQAEIPSKTIHLVEKGFTAVSRISLDGTQAGLVKGKDKLADKVLSLLRDQRNFMSNRSSITLKKALDQKFDERLWAHTSLQYNLDRREVSRQTVEAYIRGYKAAKKTKVRPRKFMEKAAQQAGPMATAKSVEILKSEFDKLVSIYRVK